MEKKSIVVAVEALGFIKNYTIIFRFYGRMRPSIPRFSLRMRKEGIQLRANIPQK